MLAGSRPTASTYVSPNKKMLTDYACKGVCICENSIPQNTYNTLWEYPSAQMHIKVRKKKSILGNRFCTFLSQNTETRINEIGIETRGHLSRQMQTARYQLTIYL